MTGILWEHSFWVFFFMTCVIAGGIAYMTGRGIASTWRPRLQILSYSLLLAAVTRFLHFALFEGTLLSLHYYIIDFVVLLALALIGFYATRAGQMARQYSWTYQRSGPLSARRRA